MAEAAAEAGSAAAAEAGAAAATAPWRALRAGARAGRRRCRAAGGDSCPLLRDARPALRLAQRQGEAERAAATAAARLRPHAPAERLNDAVAEVKAESAAD